MNFLLILLYICVNLYSYVYGSVLNIDDTELYSTPPLYSLDEWKECSRRDDVYCIVDAVLVGGDPFVLNKLQEFSNQTLKHYNRTQIHRGVCVTRCDTTDEGENFWDSAHFCVNRSLNKYGFEARVESVGWCTRIGDKDSTSPQARALAVLCTALIAFACLATGLHVLGDSCVNADGNKYLLAFSLKRNWGILTCDRSKPRSHERMKDVACIEGIRFLGMQCVIFLNVIFIYMYAYIDNPEFIENMYEQFVWKAVLSTSPWLQAFFSISGFLTAYTILLNCNRHPITIYKCFMSIVKRWIRLTPMAMFALWFTMAWLPLLGSGPQWEWMVSREASACSGKWWYHALYAHNHLSTGEYCMPHTWYLAVDMQLHVVGVILVFFLMRYPKVRTLVLLGLTLGSGLAAGLVVYWNQLTPMTTALTPEALRTLFTGSRIFTLLYLPFWVNLPGYVGGVATAFILHSGHQNGLKIKQKKWFNIVFHASLPLSSSVVLVGAIFLSDSPQPVWVSALYSTLDRILVTICFNLFLLGCFTRCYSIVRGALEKRCFHTLGRLSYCVFLTHFIILRLIFAGNTQLGHASTFSMLSLLITTSVVSYVVSVPLCLLIELPAMQLWTALTKDSIEPGAASTVTVAPQPVVRPFDLVAHLRKRHDFC